MTPFIQTLFWLLVGHALADYPLQGNFLAKAKNPYAPIPGVPWLFALSAHALIHAGAVVAVTGCYVLGAVEFVLHAVIDLSKCSKRLSFAQDQSLHVLLKVAYAAISYYAAYHGVFP
jgi:hypothetical protein